MGNQVCCDDNREVTNLNEVEPVVITKEMHLLPVEEVTIVIGSPNFPLLKNSYQEWTSLPLKYRGRSSRFLRSTTKSNRHFINTVISP